VLVVADSSPLILLSRLSLLDVLPRLYDEILVPRAVYREVVEDGEGRPGAEEISEKEWIQVVAEDATAVLRRGLDNLGIGEASAIALAVELGADLLLIDDRQGRAAAERLGLEIRGTLGVLVAAKRAGLIMELGPVVGKLKQEGAWLSDVLLRRVLESVGERVDR
jgi:uncharacterized protein